MVHVFLQVCLAQLIMCESKTRIHFDRFATLSYRFVIRARNDMKLRQLSFDDQGQRIHAFCDSHFCNRFIIPTQ